MCPGSAHVTQIKSLSFFCSLNRSRKLALIVSEMLLKIRLDIIYKDIFPNEKTLCLRGILKIIIVRR